MSKLKSLIRKHLIKDRVSGCDTRQLQTDRVQVLNPLYFTFCCFSVLLTAVETNTKHEDFRWIFFLLSSINHLQNVKTVSVLTSDTPRERLLITCLFRPTDQNKFSLLSRWTNQTSNPHMWNNLIQMQLSLTRPVHHIHIFTSDHSLWKLRAQCDNQ